jgi:hypothetical protein
MPEIYIVSNVKMNGQPIGSLGDGEAVWHTDMSYLDMPPKASMLYALEVPPTGGNTSFCSMYRIYEALPVTLKDRITQAIKSRKAILDLVATDRVMVMGYHFPFPGIGHVVRHDPAYRWEAAQWVW